MPAMGSSDVSIVEGTADRRSNIIKNKGDVSWNGCGCDKSKRRTERAAALERRNQSVHCIR